MRNIIFCWLVFSALCIGTLAAAPTVMVSQPTYHIKSWIEYHDDFLSSKISGTEVSLAEVNKKAVADFNTLFKQTSEVHWYKVSDGFMVYCMVDGIKNKVGYTFKGSRVFQFRSYETNLLPKKILKTVEDVFFNAKITWVDEVKNRRQYTYFIHLEDKSSYKIIKYDEEGEIELAEMVSKTK